MQITWDEKHGKILTSFLDKLNGKNIKWFIIRGFVGLPEHNPSKDVDMMIEVGKEKKAAILLKETFRDCDLEYFHADSFGHVHCYIALNTTRKFSIHIDLIEGYISKGFEVFTFEELYQHTILYNNMRVLDELMNGIMLLVYKIFGYHNAKLKKAYQDDIFDSYKKYKTEFTEMLQYLLGTELCENICKLIEIRDFQSIVKLEPEFTKKLKKYTWKKRPIWTLKYTCEFFTQKVFRVVFHYKKYAKVFAVLAPDGTGKTTFLDTLIGKMNFYYVNTEADHRFHVYHFRPTVLPNLGEVGEKAGVMKQDTDFTNPHRGKPANPLSSLARIAYYTLDYIVGWQKCVRYDVHYDKYTIFDRYSYDFIVDPLRTKLNLPKSVRKFFVALTPQIKIVFVLQAKPETVYARKQELELDEIKRQIAAYKELADSNKRFYIIDAEKTPDEMAEEAAAILLEHYTEKL
ncbi:MAG: hypothetical protein LUF78_13270 [Clostridiales bacterium]|nr:hypothetical protein [Clostridiales bacterium]